MQVISRSLLGSGRSSRSRITRIYMLQAAGSGAFILIEYTGFPAYASISIKSSCGEVSGSTDLTPTVSPHSSFRPCAKNLKMDFIYGTIRVVTVADF